MKALPTCGDLGAAWLSQPTVLVKTVQANPPAGARHRSSEAIGSVAHSALFVECFQGIGATGPLAQMRRIPRFEIVHAKSSPWPDLTLSKPDIFSVFTRIKMHKVTQRIREDAKLPSILCWKFTCRESRATPFIRNDPSLEEEENGQSKQFQLQRGRRSCAGLHVMMARALPEV